MIINIKDGIDYDTEKTFEEQTIEFQTYANRLATIKAQEMYPEYPEFNEQGNVCYMFKDDVTPPKLDYKWIRVQNKPDSTSDRGIKETIRIITII